MECKRKNIKSAPVTLIKTIPNGGICSKTILPIE